MKEKNKYISVYEKILIILVLFFIPLVSFTKTIDILKIDTDNLNDVCPQALACIDYNIRTIYLSENLNESVLKLALTHEVGHWFMRNLTIEDYKIFGEGTLHELEEQVANKFYDFIWLNLVLTEQEKDFFNNLIQGQEIKLEI